jgi:hypothetical protein
MAKHRVRAVKAADIEAPGYSVPEFEDMAGLAEKMAYREIRLGRIQAYKDRTGQMRIHPWEVFHYLRSREEEE